MPDIFHGVGVGECSYATGLKMSSNRISRIVLFYKFEGILAKFDHTFFNFFVDFFLIFTFGNLLSDEVCL